ncbi:MAG: right-handed parallel beta-helix repeat-containing protein [Planctomycetota bacterium]|nr:right-handed parallel beta-helix repeat-containing protein [Planctomycetota bacterium]
MSPRSFRPILFAVVMFLLTGAVGGQGSPREITLDSDDLLIEESVVVKPGEYRVADATGNGVLIIKGDDLTIDLNGAVLDGSSPGAAPDLYTGVGIWVMGGKNITIRNGTIRGFKVGIYAKESDGLKIEGCEVTRNFRQRLGSTPEREDSNDWLWPHKNDENEWMKNYGAAIYLDRCTEATVVRNRGRDQQNGIILTRTERSAVFDNDFSYHSGWGLAMWRSNGCEVSNNRFDYCVRGYSHGVYHRGQDSAGILVFEQCSDNVFAYNSATHGGDGFFLYAGHETTRETGQGGCTRNIVYGNDFSHAVANGIEATFSTTNLFIDNILDECDYGIWAGYSYYSQFLGNKISRSLSAGIAIEHGHDNLIAGNTFDRDNRGIWLWWDMDKEFIEGPFGKIHNTDSQSYRIFRNSFERCKQGIRLEKTSLVRIAGNTFQKCGEEVVEKEGCKEILREESPPGPAAIFPAPTVRGKMNAIQPPGGRRGRRTMMIDEWGPVDPSMLQLFPSQVVGSGGASIYLFGPEGNYDATATGVEVTPASGTIPAILRVRPRGPGLHDFTVKVRAGGQTLETTGTLLGAEWHVRYYRWAPRGPREGPADWKKVLNQEVIEETESDRIDFVWGSEAPSKKVPANYFATLAFARIPLSGGKYEVRTVSDDGVRLTVAGRKVIENWTWHGPTEDVATIQLTEGTHTFLLEHFEIDGHAQLQFFLKKLE